MEGGIFFNQSKYIKEMLKKFGLEDSKPIKMPMSTKTKLTKDDDAESIDNTKYRAKMKKIKEGFKKLGLLKINDGSFACNTPLGTIFNEFNRLSGMDDDLFTYEIEIRGLSCIPCDKKEEDDSYDEDLDVYEPRVRLMDVTVEQWIDLIYGDHKKVDVKVKEGVINGNDEVELIDEEFSDPDNENTIDKDEVAEIFRIKTDIFDFETPICKAFNKKESRGDIHEEREPNDNHGIDNLDNDLVPDNASYHANIKEYEDRCDFLGNPCQESPICKIKRFEMIKYSFGPTEKYVAIKECEHDDLTRTEDDACHAY
ncbi:VIER F-box protein 2 [Tanacetum coccineum]